MTDQEIAKYHIEQFITNKQFHVFEGTTVTICCLTLKNGFSVTGESATIGGFNKSKGEDVAYLKALEKIYSLEAYLKLSMMHE